MAPCCGIDALIPAAHRAGFHSLKLTAHVRNASAGEAECLVDGAQNINPSNTRDVVGVYARASAAGVSAPCASCGIARTACDCTAVVVVR